MKAWRAMPSSGVTPPAESRTKNRPQGRVTPAARARSVWSSSGGPGASILNASGSALMSAHLVDEADVAHGKFCDSMRPVAEGHGAAVGEIQKLVFASGALDAPAAGKALIAAAPKP